MNKTTGRPGIDMPGRNETLAEGRPARPGRGDLDEFENFFREQFGLPGAGQPPAAAPVAPAAAPPHPAAPPVVAAPQPAPVEDSLMAELARIVGQDVRPAPQPTVQPAAPAGAPPATPVPEHDALRAFEDELRRFDAEQRARAATAEAPPLSQPDVYAQQIALPADPPFTAEPDLRGTFPAGPEAGMPLPGDEMAVVPSLPLPPEAQPRSRKVMIMLSLAGVIALAGVIGTFGFGGRSSSTPSGQPPVIAAKPGPNKERPANPGGLEITGQDRQVLARRAEEPKGTAAVVNREEQPVDLNQTPKRETPRVVMPNPSQPGAPNPPVPILMPSGSHAPAPAAPASTAAGQDNAAPAGLEPRRVRSVRISGEGETSAPAALPQLAAAPSAPSAPITVARPTVVQAPTAPSSTTTTTTTTAPPKSDARPTTSTRTTPTPAPTPTPPARTQSQAARTTSDSNDGGPLSLRPPSGGNAAPRQTASTSSNSGGSGGYAVQFKASPSESDARSTATSVRNRFSSELDGQTPGVREATVKGRKVYRVRVGGLSQQAAAQMCNRIKAGGGSCFVARN